MIERLFNEWNFRRLDECRTLLRWLQPRPGERILDVGCGYGYNDRAIADAGAHVLGIDLDADRIAHAQRTNGGRRAEFRLMDAATIDFPNRSFDKVISFCTLEHFASDDRVLRHVHRVLEPGGVLILSVDSLSNPEISDEERRAHRDRYDARRHYTDETLREKLENAGFRVERLRYILTSPVTLACVRISWALDRLPPALLPLKVGGYVALATVGRLVAAVGERVARREGSGLTLLAQARKPVPVEAR